MATLDLQRTYLALDGAGAVTRLPAGPDFWDTIDKNADARGTLVTVHDNAKDWTSWEMHPKGDEVLFALEGEHILVFERDDGIERHVLRAGEAIVVPRGVWHRSEVRKAGRILFLTFGEGTRHKPAAR